MTAGVEAISDAAATGLILGLGLGGCLVVVVTLTVAAVRRGRRFGRRGGNGAATDGYPPQPYSAADPRTHQPYSRVYRIPRQDAAHNTTNGKHPSGPAGPQSAVWPPEE